MFYCLNKIEFEELFFSFLLKKPIDNKELFMRFSNSELWVDELGLLSYFFSQILENRTSEAQGKEWINRYYTIGDSMSVLVQDFDSSFVEFLIKNKHNPALRLEEELVEIQTKKISSQYGSLRN